MRKKLLKLIEKYRLMGKNQSHLTKDLGIKSNATFTKYKSEGLDESTCRAKDLFRVKRKIDKLLNKE